MDNVHENLDAIIFAYKTCRDDKKKRMLHIHIVEESMSLVKKIANIISSQSGINHEDLIQVGSIGLIKAIDAYKPELNTKFHTYATYYIKGEIKHYLRDKAGMIRAPRELQELVFKITSAQKKLVENGIEEPSPEDIAQVLNLPIQKVEEVINLDKYKNALSLDQYLTSEEDDFSLMDKIPSGDYQEIVNSYENKMMIASAIKRLPDELREIIEMSYFQDMSQREIAQHLKLSQMQVSRRLKKAINRLYEYVTNAEK